MHKNQQKSMELEGGGHESCTPTGGRQDMATRANVHAGKCRSMDGWTDGYQMDRMQMWCGVGFQEECSLRVFAMYNFMCSGPGG